MKKRSMKLTAAILLAALSLQLTACGDSFNEEDAKQYVEAACSLVCTGENNTGVEFADMTDEEAVEDIRSALYGSLDSEMSEYGVSDETIQKFNDVIVEALAKASYDVGDAEKTDDGYEVPVTIHPLDLYGGIDVTDVQNQVVEMATNGEIDITDEASVYDATFELFADLLEESLENPTYGDDYEMTFEITKDDDGNYTADEANGEEFGEHLFVADSF